MTQRFRALFFTFLIGLMPASRADAQQLWFSPGDDLEVRGSSAHPNFMRLFDADSPWPNGMARVNVMMFRSPWLLRTPPARVDLVKHFLINKSIKLAVPLSFISSDTCGQGVEGIGTERQNVFYPREMKKRGIDVAYVVMDEPLYYGHEYTGKNACRISIEEVVSSVADNVRMILHLLSQSSVCVGRTGTGAFRWSQ